MEPKEQKRISKLMSRVLRHDPERIGIVLDAAGWVPVSELLTGINRSGRKLTLEQLEIVVAENDKQRFEFSQNGKQIRARQGHSVAVDLGYEETEPPTLLLHGTPEKFVDSIRKQGLTKQKRHHVHLHEDPSIAASVGKRRGRAVILVVEAQGMFQAGYPFFVTENRVWLTDHVPAEYIQ